MKKSWISFFEIVTCICLIWAPFSLLVVDTELLFPYITGKNFLWRTLVECAFVGWASLAILDPRYRIPWSHPVLVCFALFVSAMLVANVFGVDPSRSFWSNAERMDGYIGLLHMFAFFVAGYGFCRNQYKNLWLPNTIICILLVVGVGSSGTLLFVNTTQPHDIRPLILQSEYLSTFQEQNPDAFEVVQKKYGFACKATARSVCTPDQERSARDTFARALAFQNNAPTYAVLVAFLGVALVVALMFQTPALIHRLLHLLLAIGVVLAAAALFQFKPRADAVLGNPIYLASFASFSFFVCVYFATLPAQLWQRSYIRHITYGALAFLFLLAIIKSGTRGAVLGLLFGGFTTAVCVAVVCKEEMYLWYRRLAWGVVVFTVASVSLFFGFKSALIPISSEQLGNQHIVTRALNFSLNDNTTKHRLANWDMAIDGFLERPITGWGQENYLPVFSKHYQADKLYNAEQWFDRTHNMFLDWMVFGGLVGLGSFLALLGSLLYVIWRYGESELGRVGQSVLTGVVVMYIAQNFVAFDSLATGIWITTICIFVALLYKETSEPAGDILGNRATLKATLIGGLWVGMIAWMSISIWTPKKDARDFMDALRSTQLETPLRVVYLESYLPSLENTLTQQGMFAQEILEQLLTRTYIYTDDTLPPALQERYFVVLSQQAESFIEHKPHNTRVSLYYANVLSQRNDYEKALDYYHKALETSPNKLSILRTIAQTYLALGQQERALEYLEQVSLLAPEDTQFQTYFQNLKRQLEK